MDRGGVRVCVASLPAEAAVSSVLRRAAWGPSRGPSHPRGCHRRAWYPIGWCSSTSSPLWSRAPATSASPTPGAQIGPSARLQHWAAAGLAEQIHTWGPGGRRAHARLGAWRSWRWMGMADWPRRRVAARWRAARWSTAASRRGLVSVPGRRPGGPAPPHPGGPHLLPLAWPPSVRRLKV